MEAVKATLPGHLLRKIEKSQVSTLGATCYALVHHLSSNETCLQVRNLIPHGIFSNIDNSWLIWKPMTDFKKKIELCVMLSCLWEMFGAFWAFFMLSKIACYSLRLLRVPSLEV